MALARLASKFVLMLFLAPLVIAATDLQTPDAVLPEESLVQQVSPGSAPEPVCQPETQEITCDGTVMFGSDLLPWQADKCKAKDTSDPWFEKNRLTMCAAGYGWKQITSDGTKPIACTKNQFGIDPHPGMAKVCKCIPKADTQLDKGATEAASKQAGEIEKVQKQKADADAKIHALQKQLKKQAGELEKLQLGYWQRCLRQFRRPEARNAPSFEDLDAWSQLQCTECYKQHVHRMNHSPSSTCTYMAIMKSKAMKKALSIVKGPTGSCTGNGCKAKFGTNGGSCFGDYCKAGDGTTGGDCYGNKCKAGDGTTGGDCYGNKCKAGDGTRGGECYGDGCTAVGEGNCYGKSCTPGKWGKAFDTAACESYHIRLVAFGIRGERVRKEKER